MHHHSRLWWIALASLIVSTLACTLVQMKTSDTIQRSEITPANTSGWVSYEGRGVRIGAPAAQWTQVPFNPDEANLALNELRTNDPSVANVFFDLMGRATNDFYKLILMKDDGTSTLTITAESLLSDVTLDDKVQQSRQSLIDQGLSPRNQRSVTLSVGEAMRWEVSVSPVGSQIVNQQLQYIVLVNNQVYYLTFTSQATDFQANIPVFEAMALTFSIS